MTTNYSLPDETTHIAMGEADLKALPSLTSAVDHQEGSSRTFTRDEEKRVLRKIDCVILPMMCFVFFCQYLDKQGLSYASIAGLIQDLKMDASQYSWCSSIFYIGQLVSEYPFIYLMSRLRLTKLVGITIVAWGSIYDHTLPLERYAGQCVESAKAMIDLFGTLKRLRYLGMFSYTDFQGCSTATVILISDCMYQGRTPDSHFVQTGLTCLEFMAIGHNQAKTDLRFVKELQSIAEDVSEKFRLRVINQPRQVGATSGVKAYEDWVQAIGTDGLTAPPSISEPTRASVADVNDEPRDIPVALPSNGVYCELTDELSAAMNQPVSTGIMLYDDVYLFGLTGLDALDYLDVGTLSHNVAPAF
ncbi:hypothetical protein KCU65_g10025, partial [Aureobasidium melanogenum]